MKRSIILLSVFTHLILHAQQDVYIGYSKVYVKPDTNSTRMEIENENDSCGWKFIRSVNHHNHTYIAILSELNDTVSSTTTAFYGEIESDCGDVGYIHSTQLITDEGGYYSFPEKIKYEEVKLLELPPENGCSDFFTLYAEFQDRSGKLINIPLNTYWGFYDTDENCESIRNTYLYDCILTLIYSVFYYYDDKYGYATYGVRTDKTIITGEAIRTVTGTNVNIRKGPGTNYEVIGKLNPGDKFSLKEIDHEREDVNGYYGSWVKILFGKVEGWIFSRYIKRKDLPFE
jgi:hypothetical protein